MIDKDKIFNKVCNLVESGHLNLSDEMDIFDMTDLLIKLEEEKILKNKISDSKIEYNDEIVYIEEMGELETIDISVSGDNLFYCNGILTKNSFGLPATCDMLFAIISNEELEKMGQFMIKQLKNRYNDMNYYKKFVIGVDKSKMKLYDAEPTAQQNIVDSGQITQEKFIISRDITQSKFNQLKV